MSAAKPKRVQTFGPEVWEQRGGVEWSLWDLWMCVIAVIDHDGNLDDLAGVFVDAIRSRFRGGDAGGEAKLSHLHDLRARLAVARLAPSDLADAAALADKRIRTRARDKVSGRVSLEWRALTPAMVDTPSRRLAHRARYGYWPSFPSDPTRFFERLGLSNGSEGFVTKGRSFGTASRLARRMVDLDGPRRSLPDRLALYRAFHTAALEVADHSDDSYGVIGETRVDAWKTYLKIDWRATGMDPAVYWQDLCELRIWEPYGLDYQDETAWFSTARLDDVALIESILLGLEREHRGAILDYQADEALEALADLYIATRARDRYASAARRLGSRAWRPIDAMARDQLAVGDRDTAITVFMAADQPGFHRDTVRRLCRDLTGVDIARSSST